MIDSDSNLRRLFARLCCIFNFASGEKEKLENSHECHTSFSIFHHCIQPYIILIHTFFVYIQNTENSRSFDFL